MAPAAGSPLLNAIRLIFAGPVRNANSSLHILYYRDNETFSDLWKKGLESDTPNVGDVTLDWNDEDAKIILVRSEPPEELFEKPLASLKGINFRAHLTAASWAAAWRLTFPDAKARVIVSGANPEGASGAVAQALSAFFGARHSDSSAFVPGVRFLAAPSLQDICESIVSVRNDSSVLPEMAKTVLRTTIWDALTSDREGHHAISNVLGAFLLSSQVGSGTPHSGEPWLQDFLLALVQRSGVLADLERVTLRANEAEQPRHQVWISEETQRAIGGAVLIDDMADIWQHFLRGALGFYGREKSFFVTSPRNRFYDGIKELPARLKTFLESKRRFLAASDLISGRHRINDRFVLFLDLRLFLEREADVRGTFFRDLAEFGMELLDSGRQLPWLDDDDKQELRDELSRFLPAAALQAPVSGGKKVLPPEETLLARLLALLDPTMPIIIFSSTHRTDLIGPFREYGNVITAFRKPIVTGMTRDWTETVKELHAEFNSALQEAERILRVRQTIRTFQERAQKNDMMRLPECQDGYLVEVFLDESEEPTDRRPPRAVCAGGVVMVRALDRSGHPVVSDEAVFDSLAASICLWGWCSDTPEDFARPQNTPQRRGFMPKGKDLNFAGGGQGAGLLAEMIGSIQTVLGEHGCVFPFAAISARSQPFPEWMEGPKGIDPWNVEKILDATLRRLVQHALEGLLFRSELLRQALGHPKSRVAVDLGIRDYPCQPNWPLFERFGFEVQRGYRPSFHSEDGYQITAETLARTGIRWPFKAAILRARAVNLWDFGKHTTRPGGLLPKQLHYFADTIAHVALDDLEAATASSLVVQKFFASGWIADFRHDNEEETRLEIGRAWDQGDRVDALRSGAKLNNVAPPNRLGFDIYQELAWGADELPGADLKRLFVGT